MIRGLTGTRLRVPIPRGVARGEIIRISGEGLPKPRGGRGDLLVRITYRVEVRVTPRRANKFASGFTITRPASTIAFPPEKIPCRRRVNPQN